MVCKSKEEKIIERNKLSTVSNTGPEQEILRNILRLTIILAEVIVDHLESYLVIGLS